MDDLNNLIKIRARFTKGLNPFEITSKGIEFNSAFTDRIYEEEENFRAPIIIPINDSVGLNNWLIRFIELPQDEPVFFVDIYVDSEVHYNIIRSIISEKLTEINFQFYYKGPKSNFTIAE